jgi:hypothetical protein
MELQGRQITSSSEALRLFVTESTERVRDDCLSKLLVGICGKFGYSVLSEASKLFTNLIRMSTASETRNILVASLLKDFFLLGPEAKDVLLIQCLRWNEPSIAINQEYASSFLEEIWKLHQVEDVDALPTSDEVARFVRYHFHGKC